MHRDNVGRIMEHDSQRQLSYSSMNHRTLHTRVAQISNVIMHVPRAESIWKVGETAFDMFIEVLYSILFGQDQHE